MDKAIELIVSWIQKNIKNPKFYAVLATLIILIAIIFPYVDANFFFYSRIEKRVIILQSLSEIDMEKTSRSPALQEEYDAILSEIGKQRELSLSGAISSEKTTNSISLFKFLSGGAVAWVITICIPFMKTFKNKKEKISAFLLLALFGAILGWIGRMIPTIIDPWINYIGYPVLQLSVLLPLAIKPKKG